MMSTAGMLLYCACVCLLITGLTLPPQNSQTSTLDVFSAFTSLTELRISLHGWWEPREERCIRLELADSLTGST